MFDTKSKQLEEILYDLFLMGGYKFEVNRGTVGNLIGWIHCGRRPTRAEISQCLDDIKRDRIRRQKQLSKKMKGDRNG